MVWTSANGSKCPVSPADRGEFMKPSVQEQRCPICDWPMASSAEKGCVPGDCSYRPDDPAEQRRISERRKALSSVSAPAQDASALADEPSRDELLALAGEQEGEAKAHLAMGDKFEARNSIIRAQSLRLRATSQTPDAVRQTIKTALVDARCTSRDTTVVTDSTANVLNVVMAALASIVSTPSASAGPQAEALERCALIAEAIDSGRGNEKQIAKAIRELVFAGKLDDAAFKNTDEAETTVVLAAIRHCANSWEGNARLLGNVRASDIARACSAAIRAIDLSWPDVLAVAQAMYDWQYGKGAWMAPNQSSSQRDHFVGLAHAALSVTSQDGNTP